MRFIEFTCFLDTCLTDLDQIIEGEVEFRCTTYSVTEKNHCTNSNSHRHVCINGGNNFNICYLILEYSRQTRNGQYSCCGSSGVVLMRALPVDLHDWVARGPDIRKFPEKDAADQWEVLSPASRKHWPVFENP